MQLHAEVTLFEVSALVDPARAGRWVCVGLWDRSVLGAAPRLVAEVKHQAAARDLEGQIRDTIARVVKWFALPDPATVTMPTEVVALPRPTTITRLAERRNPPPEE